MHTKNRTNLRMGALILLVGLLLGVAGFRPGIALAAPQLSPPAAHLAAVLPATTCTPTGPSARQCDLWAKPGTLSLPGPISMPIWGYADTALGAAQLPGPALIVNQGETVTVILHNSLTEASALWFQGIDMIPDLTGAPAAGTKSYSFVAANSGTYLYEAGLLPNAQHQVALGLFGALIVRPTGAPLQAYADPGTAFNDEALVILSEIDPALNNSLTPATFDMRKFHPAYRLINGKVYPNTDPISTLAGDVVLLRYINAGIDYHTMGLLGVDQTFWGEDGNLMPFPRRLVAQSMFPGQTYDALVVVPALAPAGTRYALYDTSLMLNNNGGLAYGGMLTFIAIPAGAPGPDTVGPATSAMSAVPNPTSGGVTVALGASVSDVASGGSNVVAAEYFIDATGANGSGIAMSGAFGVPTVSVAATLSVPQLAALPAGNHTIYVHGRDAALNWGTFNFLVLNLDKLGPATTGLVLWPNPSNGTVNVMLTGTANDQATGGSNIQAAEYFIDATGANGSGTALALNKVAPLASLSATISSATLGALPEGNHTVYVHSQDAFFNWGGFTTIILKLDKTSPVASGISAVPTPNNGTIGLNANTDVVRVRATVSDPVSNGVQSNLSRVEGFIDTIGANGTGFVFAANDGVYNSPSEAGFSDIPLATIAQLTPGPHAIYVHGKDAAGNWGVASSANLIVDKAGPVISALLAVSNPTNAGSSNNTSFVLSATATDPIVPGTGSGSNVVAAEWFEGAEPGAGSGVPMTGAFGTPSVNLSATINFMALGWTAGNHTVYVRAKDVAGNWGATGSLVVNVVFPNAIFSDGFETGNFSAWSSVTGAAVGPGLGVSVSAAAARLSAFGMQAVVNGVNATGYYVTNLTPVLDASYHARFYFNPHSTFTGPTTPITIFSGFDAAGTSIFNVQYRRLGATYQVRGNVLRAGGTSTTNWFNISGSNFTAIEIAWQSGTAASFSIYTGGALRQTLTNLNTSAYLLDYVRLGPSAGLTGGSSGTMYFDAFVSTRRTVIGL